MIAVFLIPVAVILLLYNFIYSKAWSDALTVRILFSQSHLYAGETGEVAEIIENRKRLALPVLEIGFRVPKGIQFEDTQNTTQSDYLYKRDVFAVSGMERIVRRYRINACHRGFYSVSQLTCHAPSRLFRRIYMKDRREQEGETGMYVYPAFTDCSLLLRAVEVILGERESARRVLEDPFNFASIRSYTIYDPMKTINWKASAKTGELMVNTYASPAAIRVRIFLDVSADPNIPFADSLRELAISMAATLIRTLVKRQQDAALMLNCLETSVQYNSPAGADSQAHLRSNSPAGADSHTYQPDRSGLADASRFALIPSCIGAERMTLVEQFLSSDFDKMSLIPFTAMIKGYASRPDLSGENSEVFIFLTSSDNRSLRDSIHSLLGVRHSGILAVMSRTADHRREEQEKNLHILPVYDMT